MLFPHERALVDGLQGPVIAADAEGRIDHLNAAAEALFRWPPGALVGQPLTVLMPARMRDAHRQGFERWRRTGTSRLLGRPVRVPALRGDGTEVDIELTLRMFRRPDGSDLVVAVLREAALAGPPPKDVVELETRLQRRAYQLV